MNQRVLKRFLISQSKRISKQITLLNHNQWTLLIKDIETNHDGEFDDLTNEKPCVVARFVHLPSGNYDDYICLMQRYLSLERLGCTRKLLPLDQSIQDAIGIDMMTRTLPELEEIFLLDFKFKLTDNATMEENIQVVVKDIQVRSCQI